MSLEAHAVLEQLKRVDWAALGVCHVLLIGSLAKRGRGRDVDLLVFPCGRRRLDLEELLRVVLAAADALRLDPSLVDVVDAERAPCPLLVEAAKHHRIVYTADRSALLDEFLRLLGICEDEEISARKLGVFEAAIEAAHRRWGGAGGPRKALRGGGEVHGYAG